MTFATAKATFYSWLWRLRGSYPYDEIYAQDDDVKMAHRWGIYHPNMVSMHGFWYEGILHFYDRMSFGDTTSGPSFDIIARNRKQVAQHLWSSPTRLRAPRRTCRPSTLQRTTHR
jgi:hypothetical protein